MAPHARLVIRGITTQVSTGEPCSTIGTVEARAVTVSAAAAGDRWRNKTDSCACYSHHERGHTLL